uniref:Uncharacterized protein n=1 Tax=Oryza glaberrima TaxID=4538 RepID=I1NX54_ORYGL
MGHAAAADPAASASRPHQEAAAGEQGKQGAGEQEIVSVEKLAELDSGDHNRSLAAMLVRMKAEKEKEKEDFPVMAMVAGLPMRMGPRGSTRRGTSPTTRRCWADLGGGTPRGGIK